MERCCWSARVSNKSPGLSSSSPQLVPAHPFPLTLLLNPPSPPPLTTGHKDSVTCAIFSHDSSLVATGDMGGLIKVWKLESREEIWSFEVGDLEVRLRASATGSDS